MIEKEEKALEPTADMYMTAHAHYQAKLLTNSMLAFREWREKQVVKRTAEQSRFKAARAVFSQKLCVRVCVAYCVAVSSLCHFIGLLEVVRVVSLRDATTRKGGSHPIPIDQNRLMSAVLRAWRTDARQSLKQRLWMKRLMTQATGDPDYSLEEEGIENMSDEIGKLVVNVTVFDPRLEGHMLEGKQLVARIFSHLDFKSLSRRVCCCCCCCLFVCLFVVVVVYVVSSGVPVCHVLGNFSHKTPPSGDTLTCHSIDHS